MCLSVRPVFLRDETEQEKDSLNVGSTVPGLELQQKKGGGKEAS